MGYHRSGLQQLLFPKQWHYHLYLLLFCSSLPQDRIVSAFCNLGELLHPLRLHLPPLRVLLPHHECTVDFIPLRTRHFEKTECYSAAENSQKLIKVIKTEGP